MASQYPLHGASADRVGVNPHESSTDPSHSASYSRRQNVLPMHVLTKSIQKRVFLNIFSHPHARPASTLRGKAPDILVITPLNHDKHYKATKLDPR